MLLVRAFLTRHPTAHTAVMLQTQEKEGDEQSVLCWTEVWRGVTLRKKAVKWA